MYNVYLLIISINPHEGKSTDGVYWGDYEEYI